MRLTTKGRFAVTAMIDLALRCADGPVTLAGIADRQKISLSYLEQLFGKLRRFELVSSVRGAPVAAMRWRGTWLRSPWRTSSRRWMSLSTRPPAVVRKTARTSSVA